MQEPSNQISKEVPAGNGGRLEQDAIEQVTKNAAGEVSSKVEESKEPTTGFNHPSDVTGLQLVLLAIGICLCVFMVALDTSIITTAIPRITTDFNSLADVGWYGSAYYLTNTAFQPSFGKIYTYFDVKQTISFGIGIFELGSIVCAVAKSSSTFIVGRAIAGLGGAASLSGCMLIMTFEVPIEKRPFYMAIVTGMFGVSGCVGPTLGGVLTDQLSWRWCFWINLPIGAVATCMILFLYKPHDRPEISLPLKEKLKKLDILGSVLFLGAVIPLLLALQWGGADKSWSDGVVWGCLLTFGVVFIAFVVLQWKLQDGATIPPRIYKKRGVLLGGLMLTLLQMAFNTYSYTLPFYFQVVKGLTAEDSGIRMMPTVTIIVSAFVVGVLVTKTGRYAPFMWIGGCVFTVGTGLMSTLTISSSVAQYIGYQVIYGVGAGGPNSTPYISGQRVLEENPADLPSGNAIMVFHNMLGGAIGVSVSQNIFKNTLVKQAKRLAPDVPTKLILDTGATHLKEVLTGDQLQNVIKAYNNSVKTTFIFPIAATGVLTLISFGVPNLSLKTSKKTTQGEKSTEPMQASSTEVANQTV